MSRRSWLVLLSILAHAFVLCAIIVVSVMATGAIPTPFDRVTFEMQNTVKVANVHLPVARPIERRAAAPPTGAAAREAPAPIGAPPSIAPDAGDPAPVPAENNAGRSLSMASGGFASRDVDVVEPQPPPPPQAPPAPRRVSTGIRPPTKVFNVDPMYPAAARAARIQGFVILEVVINAEGLVESAHVLRSVPLLDQAALDAVRQWRYTPAALSGVAVPVVMTLTVNFSLTER
jgi:periplasmic protein TonB